MVRQDEDRPFIMPTNANESAVQLAHIEPGAMSALAVGPWDAIRTNGNFWEMPGFKASAIAGALSTPVALFLAFSLFKDAYGQTPAFVPVLLVVLGIAATWIVVSLMTLGQPQPGASLKPYWGLLLGAVAGATVGLLLLLLVVVFVMAAAGGTDDRRRRRY